MRLILSILLMINIFCYAMDQSTLNQNLFNAVGSECEEDVKKYLDQKADPNVLIDGINAVHLASEKGFNEILLQLLQQRGDVNIPCPKYKNSSALCCAAHWQHVDVVKTLLAYQANVHASLDNGSTALHISAINGSDEIARLLVNAGAIVDAKNKEGSTPLHFAAENGKLAVAQFFIAQKANVNEKSDLLGFTPLHGAAASNQYNLVELLLNNNANIDSMSERGTALHIAANNGYSSTIKLLLLKGSNAYTQRKGTFVHYTLYNLNNPEYFMNSGMLETIITIPPKCVIKQAMSQAKKTIFPLLHVFYRFAKGEGIAVGIPQDMRKIIYNYVLSSTLIPLVVDNQLEHLKKLFSIQDSENYTPSDITDKKGRFTNDPDFFKLRDNFDPDKVEQHRELILESVQKLLTSEFLKK